MKNIMAVLGMLMMLASFILLCADVVAFFIYGPSMHLLKLTGGVLLLGLVGSFLAVAGDVTPKVTNRRR